MTDGEKVVVGFVLSFCLGIIVGLLIKRI
jgi:ABC-type nitrate/sulfonate/bicarbonate transport system permease component